MGTLDIGRVTALTDPADWSVQATADETFVTIRGWLLDSTVVSRDAKATELEQQSGMDVPVVYSANSTLDGFYRQTSARIERSVTTRPGSASGGYQFEVELAKYGTAQRVEATSNIGGLLVANDYGLIVSEVNFTLSPPVGAEAFSGVGSPTYHTRTTTDGAIEVYIGVDRTLSPTWIVDPDKYYDGGCEILTSSVVRSGLDTPEDLLTWKMRNKLIEVFADGTNDGVINIQTSADQTPYGFKILFEKTTQIPAFNYPTIVRNTAEMCILRLTRDANDNSDSLHDVYLTMRRGFPFVWLVFEWSGAATTWSIEREAADAATAITPTGASGNMAIEDSANDGDGNRWILGGFTHDAVDTTNGALDFDTNTTQWAAVIGMEIGGSTANANDDTGALMLQATAWLSETVRQSKR